MAGDAFECMNGHTCRAGDHGLMQRRAPVGDGGVDLDHRVVTIVDIDRSAGFQSNEDACSSVGGSLLEACPNCRVKPVQSTPCDSTPVIRMAISMLDLITRGRKRLAHR
jgi:hypothetical protein